MWPFGNFATADFHQIWSRNVVWCPVDELGKSFSKIFTLGVICPQNLTSKLGQTGTSLRAGYHGMHCREMLLTLRCSPRAREFPRSVNVFVRRTVAELRMGRQSCPICRFWPIFPIHNPLKTYLPVINLQPLQGLHRRMITISPYGSRRSKGVLSGPLRHSFLSTFKY